MTSVLITGATGSLGFLLCKRFIDKGDEVIAFSRNPHKQAELIRDVNNSNLHCVLGDVRDTERLEDTFRTYSPQVVIHAAALKRIERGETDSQEYLSINAVGTLNVARAAYRNRASKCLLISTDKAPQATTFYGTTKKIAEGIWIGNSRSNLGFSLFSVLRYGNVVDSNGSVWQIWQEKLKNNQQLVVRTPEPTRFFLKRKQAVDLVFQALDEMQGGEILLPSNLPAFSLWDLAYELSPDDSSWIMEPLVPGEKQHEVLAASNEYIEKRTDYLSAVIPTLSKGDHRFVPPQFRSESAHRLSGKEVVSLLSTP